MQGIAIIGLLAVTTLSATTLQQVVSLAENNSAIEAAVHRQKAYAAGYEAAKSANYPSLDMTYGATYMAEDPVMYASGTTLQVQAKNLYSGALTLSYPLFTGFAATAGIDEAKLKMMQAALATEDAKRNLYINVVQVYAAAVGLKHLMASQWEALEATRKSYEKTKGFFEQGIASPSELYVIEASLHAIEAQRIDTRKQYDIALKRLDLLANSTVSDVEALPKIGDLASLEQMHQTALIARPDLQAMRLSVQEQQCAIKRAQSGYYPSVVLYAQAAAVGDGPALDGDGYSNKNKSAAGFQLNYNLFSGFATQNGVEAAKAGKLSSEAMLQYYTDTVLTEIDESYLQYQALISTRTAAQARVKSSKAYEELLTGQYENQLADADQLSRAISALSAARASMIIVDAELYVAYSRMLLLIDNDTFLNALY